MQRNHKRSLFQSFGSDLAHQYYVVSICYLHYLEHNQMSSHVDGKRCGSQNICMTAQLYTWVEYNTVSVLSASYTSKTDRLKLQCLTCILSTADRLNKKFYILRAFCSKCSKDDTHTIKITSKLQWLVELALLQDPILGNAKLTVSWSCEILQQICFGKGVIQH